jgi:hypothetical protein
VQKPSLREACTAVRESRRKAVRTDKHLNIFGAANFDGNGNPKFICRSAGWLGCSSSRTGVLIDNQPDGEHLAIRCLIWKH